MCTKIHPCGQPAPQVYSWTTSRHQSAGKGKQFNDSLCQVAPRTPLPDGARIQYKGQRKWFGTTGPSAQTHLSSLDFSHSLIPFWSGSHLQHLSPSVTLPRGAVVKGDGCSVWHPDCTVSFWAEAGPTDEVTSQPCPRSP